MRKLEIKICIILLAVALISCSKPTVKNRPLSLVSVNGSGWERTTSYLKCDSVQMVSTSEAYAWVDGVKMKIVAEKLRVCSNRN